MYEFFREKSTSVSQHPNSRPTDTLKNEIAGLNRITEKITSLVHKTYTFEEFNDIRRLPYTAKNSDLCTAIEIRPKQVKKLHFGRISEEDYIPFIIHYYGFSG